MTDNRLYNDIINRLEQPLDDQLFERVAVDFLCHKGYEAALNPGGGDDGMDIEISDGQGEPYPGIVTTSSSVSGNMKDNLEQYKCKCRPRRKCIVVTSESLTARKRKFLYKKASELGFTLVQVYAQNEIASYLERNARWRKALLGLSGYPLALSKEPPTRSPFVARDLVGRQEALEWLSNTSGDRLLVGESGAGKTSLLYQLAKDEEMVAWFIVGKDIGEIAIAIRETDPKILMLDGAYSDEAFVEEMLRLRNHPEINGDFCFIVTCWNGDQEEFASILKTPDDNTFELDRLTQDQMVEVIADAGITNNIWLINEIVDQAAGLPGLAVTIADLALREEAEKIRTAEALSNAIIRFYKQIIDGPVQEILACFALGGNSGMHKDTVSRQLDITRYELREALESLETGGVVTEVQSRPDHIKVRPDALRHALIRDTFLSGVPSFSQSILESLVAKSPDPKATAMELIGAKARGGKFEVGFLESYIAQLGNNLWHDYQQALAQWSPKLRESFGVTRSVLLAQKKIHLVWEALAWQGYDEASWVIEHFPGKASLLAPPLLHHVPQLTIPKLLAEAIGDDRELHAHPGHPMRLLQDWVKGAYPSTAETTRRREALLRGARKWLESCYDPATGYKAMLVAMIPHYEDIIPKPGSGNAITWQEAYLTKPELQNMQSFWKEIMECTSVIAVPHWDVFLDTIENWAYPFRGQGTPTETREFMISFAKEMALNVKEAAANHRGVLRRLKSRMQGAYPDLDIGQDVVLDTLYPIRTFNNDWETQEENWERAADELAGSWINREPHRVIAELEALELEITQQWPRLTPYLCQRLAAKTSEPLQWFNAMLSTTLPADTVMPFLQVAIRRDVDGWELALRTGFATERLRESTLWDLLTCENVPDDLIQAAFSIAGEHIHVIESLVRSNQLSQERVIELFKHPDKLLVGKLAIAEWHRKDTGTIADDIRPLWEQSVIEHCEGDYWLKQIFKVEAKLAVRWFKQRFVDDSFHPSYEFRSDLGDVFAEWSLEDRRNLLDIVPYGYFYNEIVVKIIGDKVPLYERLLKKSSWPESALLAPLHRSIDAVWVAFAKLAHEHDLAPEDIVSNTFMTEGIIVSSTGKPSSTWKNWRDQFEGIRDHENAIIRQIAEIGYQRSDERYTEELNRERDQDVFGRDWD